MRLSNIIFTILATFLFCGFIYFINSYTESIPNRTDFCEEKGFTNWEYESKGRNYDFDFYCIKSGSNMKNSNERLFVTVNEYGEWLEQ